MEKPLRLAWVNPAKSELAEGDGHRPAALRLVPPPRLPSRPVNLALAIERHLAGHDGLSSEEFVAVFSGRAALSGRL